MGNQQMTVEQIEQSRAMASNGGRSHFFRFYFVLDRLTLTTPQTFIPSFIDPIVHSGSGVVVVSHRHDIPVVVDEEEEDSHQAEGVAGRDEVGEAAGGED